MTSSANDPGDARLRVEVVDNEYAAWISIHGEADHTNLEHLTALLASIDLDGHKAVQIDLSNLDFFDVAGLRQLAAFATRLRQSGLDVTTRGAHPMLQQAARILDAEDELGLT